MSLRDTLSKAVLDYHNKEKNDPKTLVDFLEEAMEDYISDNLPQPDCDCAY